MERREFLHKSGLGLLAGASGESQIFLSAPSAPQKFSLWFDQNTSPLTVRVYDGAQWVPIGQLDAANHAWLASDTITTLPTIATLRANHRHLPLVYVEGYHTANDGGEGLFWCDGSDTERADNGGAVIVDAAGHRFKRPFRADPVSARWFGTKGDSRADDTAGLQAAIDFAIAQGVPLRIPAGTYRITAPLKIGADLPQRHVIGGWKMYGDGPGGNYDGGGTVIALDGVGWDSILRISPQLRGYCEWSDFALETMVPYGANAGMLWTSTEYTQHTVRNVVVQNAPSNHAGVRIAFQIEQGTGANGEFIYFENVRAFECDHVLSSNASQAYVQRFNHVIATILSGGSYFRFTGDSGGFGLIVDDINGTCYEIPGQGITNVCLIDGLNRSASVLIVRGGRIEHLTQLYNMDGGSPNTQATPVISGLEVGIDYDEKNKHLNLAVPGGVIVDRGSSNGTVIENCRFFADHPACTFPIIWAGNGPVDTTIRNCSFAYFPKSPHVIVRSDAVAASFRIEDCKSSMLNIRDYRPVAFDRHIDLNQLTDGKRRLYSENVRIGSGVPSNLLVKPQITLANGVAATPDAPWIIGGASATLAAYGPDSGVGTRPASSAPSAKHLEIPPNTFLYQDIKAIDLSSKGNYTLIVRNANIVTVQAILTQFGGGAGGAVQIVDSESGEVYDEFILNGGSHANFPIAITLQILIGQRSTPSFPRLKIANNSSINTLFFEIEELRVSSAPASAFVLSTYGPVTYADTWDAVTKTALVTHRLALPYKQDLFGMAAPTPLTDLRSDVYVSKDCERVVEFYNGSWWQHPRITRASAPPVSGSWGCGDQVLNAAPIGGGWMGWVQITPGDIACATPWRAGVTYPGGISVYNGLDVYECTSPGRSADGEGPSGVGSAIADGTVTWRFLGSLAPVACPTAWTSSTTYMVDTDVHNSGHVYRCVTAGKSAADGGPGGTGVTIRDGNATWSYRGPLAVFKAFGQISN